MQVICIIWNCDEMDICKSILLNKNTTLAGKLWGENCLFTNQSHSNQEFIQQAYFNSYVSLKPIKCHTTTTPNEKQEI